MSKKSKGINAERELIHLFWANDWAACRIAGSGSMKYPSPDVIAGRKGRKLAIECKATGASSKYISKEEIDELHRFAEMFLAEPWIGVRFSKKEWYFIRTEDLRDSGKNVVIDKNLVINKGFLFSEMIKKG